MGKNLFVGNLAFTMTDNELRAIFEKVGQVVSAKVIMDRETGRSRGFGFVEMAEDAAAKEAINRLHNSMANGRQITVSEAQPRPQRREGAPGMGAPRAERRPQ
ncbi:MAG: RNA-binding protein [Chloroflexi bacterium]|nr:RNA-binding protein [Chloroflexota bacterium]